MAIRILTARNGRSARTSLPPEDRLPALRQVHAPVLARRFARLFFVLLLVLILALAFVPWQQSISAAGKVIAFDPSERKQLVEAPVSGRIVKWQVREGDRVQGPTLETVTLLHPEDVVIQKPPAAIQPGDVLTVEVLDDNDQPRPEQRTVKPGDTLLKEERIVKPGTVLVSIRDPNPNLSNDLAQERKAIEMRLDQAKKRAASLAGQVSELKDAQKKAILAAEKRLQAARERARAAAQAIVRAEAEEAAAQTAYQIQEKLHKDKLVSRIELVETERRKRAAEAGVESARASRAEADANVLAAEADLDRARSDTEAAIQGVTALRQQAEGDAYSAQRDLVQIKVRQRRQETQDVTAPADGTVLQIVANSATGGALVKEGDALAVVVPDIPEDKDRRQVVELFVDGNDAPLVTSLWREKLAQGEDRPTIPVRLQFEGWPAIQFVGWPSVAVGTFGGKVVYVDPHADTKGQFRVLVERDPTDEPWPKDFSLRQGQRASGWVLLNRVPLWWEAWRRLNGFPPVVAPKEPDEDGKPTKEPKPKLPK